jgi:hypothetical protein
MAYPSTGKIHTAAASVGLIAPSGGGLGEGRRHVVLFPARASLRERRQAMIGNLLGRLEAAAYTVVSFGVITIAATFLIASFIFVLTMIIDAML